MRNRRTGLRVIPVAFGLLGAGCGGESGSPSQPPSEPFIAKGKLKSEMDAQDKLEKIKKSVPAR
jgi:hypothetical protein